MRVSNCYCYPKPLRMQSAHEFGTSTPTGAVPGLAWALTIAPKGAGRLAAGILEVKILGALA